MIGRNLLFLIKMIIIKRKGSIVLAVKILLQSLLIEKESVKFNLPPSPKPLQPPPPPPPSPPPPPQPLQ
jgi:hypothetical protein